MLFKSIKRLAGDCIVTCIMVRLVIIIIIEIPIFAPIPLWFMIDHTRNRAHSVKLVEEINV